MAKQKNQNQVQEWKEFKKYFGITTLDVALIIGIDPKSVQNATAPSFIGSFPAWAKLAMWVWKKSIDRQILIDAERIRKENDEKMPK